MTILAPLAVALALAAAAANAAASDYMPSAMIGDWCIVRDGKTTQVYRRGKCHGPDDWLTVRRDGFHAHETDCALVAAAGTHLAFRCYSDEERTTLPWSLIDRWRLRAGRLVIDKR